jgi:hypothetical protein
MATPLQDGRKVCIERDDGTIVAFRFHDEECARSAVSAIELAQDDEGPITVRELHSRWLIYHATVRMKPATLAVYEKLVAPLLDEFGDVTIDQLDPDIFVAYFRLRVASGKYAGLMGSFRTLSAILGVAVKWAYLDENPISMARILLAALTFGSPATARSTARMSE